MYAHAAAASFEPQDAVYHTAIRFITRDSYHTHHC